MEGYVQDALPKELLIAPFVERFKATIFGKSYSISTWNNLPRHCVFANSLLTVCYVQGALREELFMALFVECFKTATLGKS